MDHWDPAADSESLQGATRYREDMAMKTLFVLLVSMHLAVLLTVPAQGEEARQADWSGGDGLPGPVTQWGNRFADAQSIDWADPSAGLTLLPALPYPHQVTTTFGEPACVDAADLDGDQDIDLVCAAYQGDEVAWWENDGAGGGWIQHTIATGVSSAASVHAADIDGDGDMDVAATAEGAQTVAWWENDGAGGGWLAHPVDTSIGGPFCVCSGDFDGDQDLDLCGAAFYAADIVWWENTDGAGNIWIRHTIDPTFQGAWWTVAADIDDDTDLDIVGAAYAAGDICWYENGGNGATWTKHFICPTFPYALNVRAADMDGDNDLDVVGASNAGVVAWWENEDPAGAWVQHPIDSGLDGPFSLRVIDLDGDDDQDVITNERDADRVRWYENVDSRGGVWLAHLVDETSDGPNDVLAADVDGNTVPEIIATFSWDGSVVWYEPASEYADSGSLESSILDGGGPVPDWGSIAWNCATPAGTSVSVEVRGSSDPGAMGPWAEVMSSGDDLSDYIVGGTRYLQYRVSLATTEGAVSPGFQDIFVAWEYLSGVAEDGTVRTAWPSCSAASNPSRPGAAAIRFAVPSESDVELGLYDIGGRRLATVVRGHYPAGEHLAPVRGLTGGIYLYSLRVGEFRETGKIVMP
jgi:hypothetical protein